MYFFKIMTTFFWNISEFLHIKNTRSFHLYTIGFFIFRSLKKDSIKNLFQILNEFAAVSGCCLKSDQDACGGMTVTLRSKYGGDITANQKQMHMAIAFADHIAVIKWAGAVEVELTLIYGIPEED